MNKYFNKILNIIRWSVALLSVVTLLLAGHFCYSRLTAYKKISVDLEPLLAFTSFPSYPEGSSIPVFYHSTQDSKAELFQLGETLVSTGIKMNLETKEQDNNYSPVKGFSWKDSIILNSEKLKSAYYILKIKHNNSEAEYNLPIVITPTKKYKVAVIANTNTWQAYNTYGGRSYYDNEVDASYVFWMYRKFPTLRPLSFLPFKRPYKEVEMEMKGATNSIEEFDKIETITDYKKANLGSALLRGEWTLAGFLEKNKIDYGVFSDYDFCNNPSIDEAEVIMFHVHSEYWSEEMMGKLNALVEKGKKIIFLSGNNIYREIENTEYGIQVTRETIEMAKTRALCGSYYTEPTYPKLAPYKVMNASHWVFEGCNLKQGDLFGKLGASGNETDKIGFDTKEFQTLAIGTNYAGPAYMIIKENKNGGFVFNTSSLMFSKYLQRDSVLDRIVLNLIGK